MKKVIFAIMLVVACVSSAFAATEAEVSAERIAKLEKLVNKEPGKTGIDEIDGFVGKVTEAAKLAIANSVMLKTAVDGDLSVVPTLALAVKSEGEAVVDADKMSADAAQGIKKVKSVYNNPMKVGKAKKALDYATECLKMTTEESAYQAQVLGELSK